MFAHTKSVLRKNLLSVCYLSSTLLGILWIKKKKKVMFCEKHIQKYWKTQKMFDNLIDLHIKSIAADAEERSDTCFRKTLYLKGEIAEVWWLSVFICIFLPRLLLLETFLGRLIDKELSCSLTLYGLQLLRTVLISTSKSFSYLIFHANKSSES